jgi:hypothetical protein
MLLKSQTATRSTIGNNRAHCSKEGGRKVKRTIIALSAAALIAAAPAVFAHSVLSKTPGPQHKTFKKHPARVYGYAPWAMQAQGHAQAHAQSSRAYPGAFGYVPARPRDMTDILPLGGGGGGGGGGGM